MEVRIRDWFRRGSPSDSTSAPDRAATADRPAAQASEPRPAAQTEEPTIEISGEFLNQLWTKRPVRAFRDADAAMAHLSQERLPYLWADDPAYAANVDGKSDPQRELRVAWVVTYLNHPDPEVIRRTLRDHVTPELARSWLVAGSLPALMIHLVSEVREEAARAICGCEESALRSVLRVFSGDYTGIPSDLEQIGATGGEFRRQQADIVSSLREQCPPEKRAFFEAQVSEVFGPSLAEEVAPELVAR